MSLANKAATEAANTTIIYGTGANATLRVGQLGSVLTVA